MLKKLLSSESAASMIALVGVVIVFTLINDRFLTRLNIEGIIVSASISAIVGLGMTSDYCDARTRSLGRVDYGLFCDKWGSFTV